MVTTVRPDRPSPPARPTPEASLDEPAHKLGLSSATALVVGSIIGTGVVVSTAVASLLMAWSYSGETGLKVFTYLVYLSVVTVAIPYFLSACAQLAYLVSRRRVVQGWALARDLTISVVGGMFSLWVTFASGYQSVYQALLLLLIGIPIYGFLKARRERLGLVEEPVDSLVEVV